MNTPSAIVQRIPQIITLDFIEKYWSKYSLAIKVWESVNTKEIPILRKIWNSDIPTRPPESGKKPRTKKRKTSTPNEKKKLINICEIVAQHLCTQITPKAFFIVFAYFRDTTIFECLIAHLPLLSNGITPSLGIIRNDLSHFQHLKRKVHYMPTELQLIFTCIILGAAH